MPRRRFANQTRAVCLCIALLVWAGNRGLKSVRLQFEVITRLTGRGIAKGACGEWYEESYYGNL